MTIVPEGAKPILFKPELVAAILDGRKRQSRRIVKPPRYVYLHEPERTYYPADRWWVGEHPNGGFWAIDHPNPSPERLAAMVRMDREGFPSPYKVGDLLWVRETHALEDNRMAGGDPPFSDGRPILWDEDEPGTWTIAHYKATDPPPDLCCESPRCRVCRDDDFGPHWRPSIHMPKWACRLMLEVTEVRVERLQEISEEDYFAEGFRMPPIERTIDGGGHEMVDAGGWWRHEFKKKWDAINGDRAPYSANSWVFVYTFKIAKRADGR